MADSDPSCGSKRQQIIDAAVAEFRELGFASASMDRVSARAGVSKRTVYKYFESKENLFRAIVEIFTERFAALEQETYVPGQPIRGQLTALAWAEGRILLSPDTMAMARMLISETLRSPELAGRAESDVTKRAVFVAFLKAAAEDGQLRLRDAESAADEFLALIKARAFWPVMFGADLVSEAQMQEIVDNSVEMMLSRYGV